MAKKRVGVLRGGPSREYDVSLKSGATVLKHLPEEHYEPKEIYIDRDGIWHVRGFPVDPARALSQVDVVFNALHGTYGEDGQVQKLLETHGIPYTGSTSLGSAVAMNKVLAKERAKGLNVLLAHHRVFTREEATERGILDLFRSFTLPLVLKPVDSGSSVHLYLVTSFAELTHMLEAVFKEHDRVLVEQYLNGKEATVGVVEGFRGEDLYALPTIEIVPTKSALFDYAEKYDGHAEEICPARFGPEMNKQLEQVARDVHSALGLRHYSRSDFIITRQGIFFLEVNTLPGLTEASLMPKAIAAVGSSLPEFLHHLIGLAVKRR